MAKRGDGNKQIRDEVDDRYRWVLDMDIGPSATQLSEPPAAAPRAKLERAQSESVVTQLLTKVPLFHELSGKKLREFFKRCAPIAVKQGDAVCAIGAPSEELFVLLSGEVAVLLEDGVRVAVVKPVTTLGEMGFVTGQPRSATLLALQPCSLLVIKNAHLQTMLRSDPGTHLTVFRNIIEILSARIINVNCYMRDHLLAARDGSGDEDLRRRLQIAVELLASETDTTSEAVVARIDREMSSD